MDARSGVLTQTRRDSFIVSLLGIRHVVLAVNKMDLVDFDQKLFESIVSDYREFASTLKGIDEIVAVPISALRGDNVLTTSESMNWYSGPSLMDHLNYIEFDQQREPAPFSMSVQLVNRPNSEFRGYSGRIDQGQVSVGDKLRIVPSGHTASVERIVTHDGDLEVATAGQLITVVLDRQIDVSRGDVLATADDPPQSSDQFDATIVWMSESPLLAGRCYDMKIGTMLARATITKIKHSFNVNSMEHIAATKMELNEIGECNISIDRQIPFRPYEDSKELGGFILIDRQSNNTIGLGLINFSLRRGDNLHMQSLFVDRTRRAAIKKQKAAVLWFTGLSGSGKSTIANIVEQSLADQGLHTILLDGDNVRHGWCQTK